MALDKANVIATLRQAGFKGSALRDAWAIARRESGFRPDAFNPDRSTGDQSYGLFQINMLGDLGPARRKQLGLARNEDLFDPLTNARAAFRLSKGGTDFGPWGVGPNAYRQTAPLDYSGFPGAPPVTPPQKPTIDALSAMSEIPAQQSNASLALALLSASRVRRGQRPLSPLLMLSALRRDAEPVSASAPAVPASASAQAAPSARGPYPFSPLGDFAYKPLGAPGQGMHSTTEGPNNWQTDSAWDFGAPAGTPVYATQAGTVEGGYGPMASSGRFGGSRLNVRQGEGSGQYYAHLAENLVVRPGQRVTAGQLLGYVGDVPGLAQHVHFANEQGSP